MLSVKGSANLCFGCCPLRFQRHPLYLHYSSSFNLVNNGGQASLPRQDLQRLSSLVEQVQVADVHAGEAGFQGGVAAFLRLAARGGGEVAHGVVGMEGEEGIGDA